MARAPYAIACPQPLEVREDALAILELMAAASVPLRAELYEAGAVPATGKLMATEGWRCPHLAAWLLCRLAQLSPEAQHSVIGTGMVTTC